MTMINTDRYCTCHRLMGNDWFFMPKDQCTEGECDGDRQHVHQPKPFTCRPPIGMPRGYNRSPLNRMFSTDKPAPLWPITILGLMALGLGWWLR